MYHNWKAAFTACVNKALATTEYKVLQLRECLAGVALYSRPLRARLLRKDRRESVVGNTAK